MNSRRLFTTITLVLALLGTLSGMAPVALSAPLPAPHAQPPAWYNEAWAHRKPITINHTQVSANLTDFPVLISLDSDAGLAASAQDDADDILFTDAGGSKLNHEIEYFDGDTGQLVAWVNVSSLPSSVDTILYMYYGNSAATNQENPGAVWDTDYAMVQHLSETSGTHMDSTLNGNDGAPQNGLLQGAMGMMDGADDFAGADEFIDVGTDSSMDVYGPNQDFSIFLWIRRDATGDVQGFFSSGSSGPNGIYFGSAWQNTDDLRFLSPGNTFDLQSTSGVIGDTGWHYVGVTADRDGNMTFWVDGAPAHSASMAAHSGADWNRTDDTYKIGTDRSENNPMDGIIDEVRVSDIVRSPDWIAAEYANVSAPDEFFNFGSEQTVNVPIMSNENPPDGTEGVSVSLTQLSFYIEDPEGDSLDFSVTTAPNIGSRSESGVGAGTYSVDVSGLDYGVTYHWYVDVTDGAHPVSREYTFTTEIDQPIITNEDPPDGASYVGLNPTLRVNILDQQGEAVEWEISVYLDDSWQVMNSGTLPTGSGTVSATTTGIDEPDATYPWRVRARDAGSGIWIEETYSFQTISNEISFATFADTHVGGMIETGWGMADHMDSLAQDIMDNTVPCDFVVHLGDIIMHSAAYVEGESLPTQYDQYYNNFKAYLLQYLNMPFMSVAGNHDLNDYYGENHSGYPHNGDDPFNLVRALIDATEMNSYPFAFMKNNILFIALPETDYHHYTKPTIYEYVEYMARRYPDNTTIIFSHQAIEDTTVHDGGLTSTYRAKQDREWWAQLFRDNPQIKMWIHGHQHMLDWYQSDHSSGITHPVEDFGHEMVFTHPYSQADWGNYHEEDRVVIYSVSADGITTRAWENNGSGGHWISDFDHQWDIATTYDESAQDWYSFPIFIQDGEIQLTDMKAVSPRMGLELIGTQPMELFYDPTMATQGTSWGGENILGFGNDYYAEATPTLPGMTVHGPADLDFPPKYPGSAFQGGGGAYHEDGRTGQPYHYFPVGTTHAAVPGATYEVTITARSASGTGRINVDLSASDWGTRSQYSTLAGSTQRVISHAFGTGYETVTGTYTVPNDENAWFLQGFLDFLDSTDYDVSLFSIKRVQDSPTTDDFGLALNGTWYNQPGTLAQYQRAEFTIDPTTLADENGVIEITSSIDGNHFGMARLVYYAPMLMGRNARFTVNSIAGNNYNITLQEDLSYFSDTFKMFPLSKKYGSFVATSDDGSAVKRVSGNGNEWIESNTPTGTTKVTLDIEYGVDPPTISDESPANFATDVDPNPTLSAHIQDLQGDQVDWEIRTDASGTWQTIDSGTLPDGDGPVMATPTNMTGYNTTYFWSVRATDVGGSGEMIEETYRFTTRPENYPPSVTNPSPEDGAVHVPPNPVLSIDISDPDGDLMDVVFQTDASGVWEDITTYTGAGDGTYTATPTTMGEYATIYHWRVRVDDGSDLVTGTYTFTTRSAPGSWWDATWAYRKEIVIDHTLVDEDLSSFPVLIDITDPDLAAYAQAGGDDIVFTDEYGIQLSHEIEHYEAGTGHLIAWVNVPSLSSSEDTTLFMYFGNSGASNQEDVEGTWQGHYVMVHHLEEAVGTHFDSTAYANDGTTVVVTDQDATGKINGADEFDGADDYVRAPNDVSIQFGEGSFTAEAWIYPNSIPDAGGARIANNRGTGAGGQYEGWQLKIADESGRWEFRDTSIDDGTGNYMGYEGTTTYGYNEWYHVVMVYDADNELAFYVNGGVDGTLPVGAYGSLTNSLPTAIGGSIAHGGVEGVDNRQFFDGIIDEVKLSDVARSAGWISTSFNNQNDPSTFLGLGDLELESGPPEVSNPLPLDGASNVSVSLSGLSFDLYDPNGDVMAYTVTTTPDVGSDSVTDVGDGTYTVAVGGLAYDTTYTWEISVSDGENVTNQVYTFITERQPAAWWDSDWSHRRTIIIDHTQVAEDLTSFPVLIEIDDGSLVSVVQDDGDDILFTDYGGTKLNHEIELYDSATGILVAWVNVPLLSSTQDTILYMYYGNSEASNQENVEAVWDSDYVLVQHLDEISGTHYDSTGYNNDGTPYNLASQDAVGQIDGADEFQDSADLIDVGTDASLDVFGPSQDFSVFLWARRDDVANVHGFFSSGSSGPNGIFFGTAWQNFDDLRFLSPDNTLSVDSTNDALGDTDWHYVGLTADRDGDMNFWVDGVSVHSTGITAYSGENWNRVDDVYKIGTDRSESGSMDGILDEVRVSRIVRSPGWILTSYNNQNDPGVFYDLSPVETYARPRISDPSPPDGAVDVPTSTAELSVEITDAQGDDIDWSITSIPDIGSCSGANEPGGTKNCSIVGLGYHTVYAWTVQATDPLGSGVTTTETFSFTTERELGAWYDYDWLYRKPITIDHTLVDGDLIDFPVLIELTDSDLASWAQNDGDDILLTSAYDDALDHEIEDYDETTGHLIVWVKVPYLSSTQDTLLYMYYGNADAENQENAEGVWDSHYVMVQHLEETSGTHFDSTAFDNDGTIVVVTDQDATGKIDGADEFDGADDYVRVPDDTSVQFGEGSFTAEAWIYPSSIPDSGGARIINNRGTGAGGQYEGWQLKIANASGQWRFRDASVDDAAGNYRAYEGIPTYAYSQWYQVVMVYDADNELRFYVNGGPDGNLAVGNYGDISNSLPTVVGASLAHNGVEGGDGRQFFDGVIDEVRLSDIARSAEWISTEFNNQNDPGSFYRVGNEELGNHPPVAEDDDVTTPEDTPITVDVAENDTDEDDNLDPSSTASTSVPTSGALLNNGDGTFTYTPAPDFDAVDWFDYEICDTQGLCETAAVTITVTSVNDAPVNTVPGTQTTNVDVTLVFSASNLISISDIDAGEGDVQVTLSAANGTVTLSGTADLSFSLGDGTDDDIMTFTGTITSVNAALDGMSFTPTPGYRGAASLEITANDQGHTGSDGPFSDTDTVEINVEPAGGGHRILLPIIVVSASEPAPDLVVDSLVVTSSGVAVTIRNTGNAPVVDAFWVDVYFNPSTTPGLDRPWDTIASHGVVWGVTTSIPEGGSLTLASGGDYYFPEHSSPAPLPVGAEVYVLVDSINYDSNYGSVRESDEDNNLFGPINSTTGDGGPLTAGQGRTWTPSMVGLSPR